MIGGSKNRVVSGLMVGALLASDTTLRARDKAEISVPANRISQPIIGLLITQKVFGAPGYGENPKTDAKRNIYVLETGVRVRLSGDGSSPSGSDDGPNSWAAAERLKGKCVTVSGSARRAQVAAEHTPVVLQVATIRPRLARLATE